MLGVLGAAVPAGCGWSTMFCPPCFAIPMKLHCAAACAASPLTPCRVHLSPRQSYTGYTSTWYQAMYNYLATESTKPARKGRSTVLFTILGAQRMYEVVLNFREGSVFFKSHEDKTISDKPGVVVHTCIPALGRLRRRLVANSRPAWAT